MRTSQVVVAVFPDGCVAMELQAFREGQCFAGLPSIEETTGQIAAFDISGTLAQELDQFILLAIEDP